MRKSTAFLLITILALGFWIEAFARDYHEGHYRGGHYRYHDGRYYRRAGWWGFGGLVTGLAIGAYVASLPPRHETIIVSGVPYYYADGYYYRPGPGGYVVVEPPVIVEDPYERY